MRLPWLHSRRTLNWSRLTDLRTRSSAFISTAGGAGLFPWGPGTMGTLVGIPIAYGLSGMSWPLRLLFWGAVTLLGSWAATVFDRLMDTKDNQNIVIDEVIGYGISAWSVGTDPKSIMTAFLLFRLFDILKLPPVRQVDRWSRNKAGKAGSWWNGFGVIADDILAGLQALAVILVLQSMHWLS